VPRSRQELRPAPSGSVRLRPAPSGIVLEQTKSELRKLFPKDYAAKVDAIDLAISAIDKLEPRGASSRRDVISTSADQRHHNRPQHPVHARH